MVNSAATFVQFFKTDKQPDGSLMVYGKATDDSIDSDQQICDPDWLKSAMPDWFRWGNIREQHSNIAAGVATEYEAKGSEHYITAHIVDPNSVKKVESGVLKGFSIGIRAPRVVKDTKAAGGRIVDGQVVEVSLVDRPANPNCTLTVAKAVDGELTQVEELVEKRDVSTEERERLASRGHAMPDGSYPIANVSDLKNAIQAFGRAKNPAATKKHIIRRARALGATDLLPEGWTKKKKEKSVTEDVVKAADPETTAEESSPEESTAEKAMEESTPEESTAEKADDACPTCGKSMKECKCAEGGYSATEMKASESSQTEGEVSSQAFGEESSRPDGVAGVAGKTKKKSKIADLKKQNKSIARKLKRVEKQLAILVDAHTEALAKAANTEDVAKSVAEVTERLSVVEKAAGPGPVRTRVAPVTPAQTANPTAVKIAEYREKALKAVDPSLAQGYTLLADELEKSL